MSGWLLYSLQAVKQAATYTKRYHKCSYKACSLIDRFEVQTISPTCTNNNKGMIVCTTKHGLLAAASWRSTNLNQLQHQDHEHYCRWSYVLATYIVYLRVRNFDSDFGLAKNMYFVKKPPLLASPLQAASHVNIFVNDGESTYNSVPSAYRSTVSTSPRKGVKYLLEQLCSIEWTLLNGNYVFDGVNIELHRLTTGSA